MAKEIYTHGLIMLQILLSLWSNFSSLIQFLWDFQILKTNIKNYTEIDVLYIFIFLYIRYNHTFAMNRKELKYKSSDCKKKKIGKRLRKEIYVHGLIML